MVIIAHKKYFYPCLLLMFLAIFFIFSQFVFADELTDEQIKRGLSGISKEEREVIIRYKGFDGKGRRDFPVIAGELRMSLRQVEKYYGDGLYNISVLMDEGLILLEGQAITIKEAIKNYSGIFSNDELVYLKLLDELGSRRAVVLRLGLALGDAGPVQNTLNSAIQKINQLPRQLAEEAKYLEVMEVLKNSEEIILSPRQISIIELRYTRKSDGSIRKLEEIATDPLIRSSVATVSKDLSTARDILIEKGLIKKLNIGEIFRKYFNGSKEGKLKLEDIEVVKERLNLNTGEPKSSFEKVRDELVKRKVIDEDSTVGYVTNRYRITLNKVKDWDIRGVEPLTITGRESFGGVGAITDPGRSKFAPPRTGFQTLKTSIPAVEKPTTPAILSEEYLYSPRELAVFRKIAQAEGRAITLTREEIAILQKVPNDVLKLIIEQTDIPTSQWTKWLGRTRILGVIGTIGLAYAFRDALFAPEEYSLVPLGTSVITPPQRPRTFSEALQTSGVWTPPEKRSVPPLSNKAIIDSFSQTYDSQYKTFVYSGVIYKLSDEGLLQYFDENIEQFSIIINKGSKENYIQNLLLSKRDEEEFFNECSRFFDIEECRLRYIFYLIGRLPVGSVTQIENGAKY